MLNNIKSFNKVLVHHVPPEELQVLSGCGSVSCHTEKNPSLSAHWSNVSAAGKKKEKRKEILSLNKK